MLIPIGHDKTTVRRWPLVTFAIVALNVAAFALIYPPELRALEESMKRLGAVEAYWTARPHLLLPDGVLTLWLPRERVEEFS